MLYNLCLPLHLQPLHRPQHETHTRISPVKLRIFITLCEGLLECPGAMTIRSVRGDKERSVVYQTKSPGTLEVKAGEKLVSTVCQKSRLDTTSGKACYASNVRADGFGATRLRLGLLPGSCIDKGVLDIFLRRKDTVRSYWSEQFIAEKKTKKSSDKPPTDQEHRPGDRADQAHRVQLTARSISFGCLILGGAHCFQFSFLLAVPSQSFISSTVFLSQH